MTVKIERLSGAHCPGGGVNGLPVEKAWQDNRIAKPYRSDPAVGL
jgi:hypothetical protein